LLLIEQWEYPVARVVAANVDTLFVVSSLNEDFNLNRIERYLSLANEAQTEPVIILSKADLCEDVESLCRQVCVSCNWQRKEPETKALVN
jgi:putative ribosome biogenesis GTPase RsgA